MHHTSVVEENFNDCVAIKEVTLTCHLVMVVLLPAMYMCLIGTSRKKATAQTANQSCKKKFATSELIKKKIIIVSNFCFMGVYWNFAISIKLFWYDTSKCELGKADGRAPYDINHSFLCICLVHKFSFFIFSEFQI